MDGVDEGKGQFLGYWEGGEGGVRESEWYMRAMNG